MTCGVCVVAPAAPPSPESADDVFCLRQDGGNYRHPPPAHQGHISRAPAAPQPSAPAAPQPLHVYDVLVLVAPAAPQPLDVDAMVCVPVSVVDVLLVFSGSSSSSISRKC